MSDPHQGIQTDFATHEWTEADEDFTPATQIEVVKAARESSGRPRPVAEEHVEVAEDDLLESEGAEDDGPPEEGDPEEPAPEEDTADGEPETDEGHPRRYADKYETPEALEAAHRHLQSLMGRQAQQLQQAQSRAAELEDKLAQQQRVPDRPPRFNELSPDSQNRFAAEVLSEDPTLRDYPDELVKRIEEAAKADWRVERKLEESRREVLAERISARETAKNEALEELVRYGSGLEKHSDHVIAKFSEHPEVFEVIRSMEPKAIKSFGERYLNLIQAEAELQQMKGRLPARDHAMRQSGRNEARETEARKAAGVTSASKVSTVRTAPPPEPKTAPRKSGTSTLNRLLSGLSHNAPDPDWDN